MGKLLNNKSSLLDRRTIQILQKSSEQFEKKQDRSILVLGLSVTESSLIPFFLYLLSAILFMNRIELVM